ncbi:right-handed parallel beta-helix repeat-containing protein [Paenibacillus alba]|uniref:Right-handed parallel beta-helix repeat-containing protein n=1 Tax=Paenibacillus alba TaxID=1197127 RepID=A0ABU6G5G6_9BACL|nr:right-handed parallel beta-helix repeat-containing protein [Paenibacillus alba]MEC0228024.1 right-handed parallel beta-helix repeat-containing protein [Paenibacillus alba]
MYRFVFILCSVCLCLLPVWPHASYAETAAPASVSSQERIYELDLAKWHIYNDNSHAAETTDGFNDALKWAHDQGFNVFKVPAGTYLIAKGTDGTWDARGRINMVSDMKFWLDEKAVIQKEQNGFQGYTTLLVGVGVKNVTIAGGTYRGDRDTHDYSKGGTHEGGYGIATKGAINVTIDGVKTNNFTGDGLYIAGGSGYMQDLYENGFESGGLDDQGNLTKDSSKIRTKASWKLTDPSFDLTHSLIIDNGHQLPDVYDIYFYKANGTFLSKVKQQPQGKYVPIPAGSDSMRLAFSGTIQKGTYVEIWNRVQSTNITIRNADSSFNRRQGLSISGGKNVTVQNSAFHDIGGKGGTAPMAGIDVEGGAGDNGFINENITIKNNKFYKNSRYDVIFYDGHDGLLENNHLASTGAIGLAVSDPFTGATIKDNNFEGTSIYASHDVTFIGNAISDSLTHFDGPNINIKGMTATNTNFAISSSKPFGVTASDITINLTKKTAEAGLSIWLNPVHLTNVTITGAPALRAVSGGNVEGNIFDNLTVTGYNSTYGLDLPPGTYNNCVFNGPTDEGKAVPSVGKPGKYVFNNCSFTGYGGLAAGNENLDLTITNSKFNLSGNTSAISVTAAKKVHIENNQITASGITTASTEIIKLNDFWQKAQPNLILSATIKGNTITSNMEAVGISTMYVGTGAPAFQVWNNILNKAILKLKANDIHSNN